MSSTQASSTPKVVPLDSERERLADLERRSLLAEQARQQAHHLRTPLSVIKLISETLELELIDDQAHRGRLQRLLGAASTLSNALSDTVRSTRFGDGPPQRLDATTLAARIVRIYGGRVVSINGEAASADGGGLEVQVERDTFEAALVHCLRLIGIGTDCNGVCAHQPVLECRAGAASLTLRITAEGRQPPDIPGERADFQLMALAAERAARESGGTLTLTNDSATLELPLAPSAD
ncbi:hypothetical protein [Thiocystis violacea]|uniref:hypothetical protein n=1 Tax=Thiocystis violacea TaxID=13725 RepID=UPI00190727C3|nr:hypothetical protein [Thiocystis violacea]MBK1724514.1 hypothetical protein [Thiocystis violacea]